MDRGEVKPADLTHVISFYAMKGHDKRWLASFNVPRSEAEARVVEFSGSIACPMGLLGQMQISFVGCYVLLSRDHFPITDD